MSFFVQQILPTREPQLAAAAAVAAAAAAAVSLLRT